MRRRAALPRAYGLRRVACESRFLDGPAVAWPARRTRLAFGASRRDRDTARWQSAGAAHAGRPPRRAEVIGVALRSNHARVANPWHETVSVPRRCKWLLQA